MAKRNYRIDHSRFEIIISKVFNDKASIYDSEEYVTLKLLQTDFPKYRIRVEYPAKRKKSNKISYDQMFKYISNLDDNNVYLKMFSEQRKNSLSSKSPYEYVRKWFVESFPDYGKPLTFDKSGKPIIKINVEKNNIKLVS